MPIKNVAKRRAYYREYYQRKIAPKKRSNKWTLSKRAWVRCPFCGKNRHYKPIQPHNPEVMGFAYGGRGRIRRIPESKLIADGAGDLVKGIKAAYIAELKKIAARFLYCYCTREELVQLMNDMGVKLHVAVEVPSRIGIPTRLSAATSIGLVGNAETQSGWEVKARWHTKQ